MAGFMVFIESLLCVLLIIMMAYAAVIRQNLMTMKAGREDFKVVMDSFNQTVNQCACMIDEFKKVSQREQKDMSVKISHALSMCEDLEFLIARSEALSSQMEKISKTITATSPLHPVEQTTCGKMKATRVRPVQDKIMSLVESRNKINVKSEEKPDTDDVHDELKIFKILQNMR